MMYRSSCLALVMAIAMTLLSAYIRLSDSGIGCSPWPACFTEQVIVDDQPGVTIASTDTHRGLRMLHRMMASGFALIVMVMTIIALWYRRRIDVSPVLPVFCLLLTLMLAVVGLNTPDVIHPVVTGINLTGGMLVAGLLWQLVLIQRRGGRAKLNRAESARYEAVIDSLTGGAIIIVLLTIASGSWVSANFASGACDGLFSCGAMDGASIAEAFDPDRELTMVGSRLILDANQALITWVHQWLALLSALLVVGLTAMIILKRGADFVAFMLTGLTAALILIGIIDTSQPSVLSAWLHNLLSLSLWLMLIYQFNRFQFTNQAQASHD